MPYRFRDSGYGGCDFLAVTPKGKEHSGFPDGIVIPSGLAYSSDEFKNWLIHKEYEENGYYIFAAKHCDNPDEFTHVSRSGVVNRFGYFITRSDIFRNKSDNYAFYVQKGDFVRKNVRNFTEALKYVG